MQLERISWGSKDLQLVACATALLVAFTAGCGSDGEGASANRSTELEQQLERLREVAITYQDVNAATAAGYVPLSECTEAPGMGGMGMHYGNPSKIMAPADPADPPILLYVPDSGALRLAGVEFLVPLVVDGAPYMGSEQSPPPQGFTPATPPEIFQGHAFDGPMPGHDETMPWHYDQHVWLFEENPSGMFAAWNPKVSCAQ
jgi:hypothetical protein